MKIVNPAAVSPGLTDERACRADQDRIAEERSENDGVAEHVEKGVDPVGWERQRIERTSSDYPVNTVSFEMRYRTGIWEVSRDGCFLGDFLSETEALAYTKEEIADVVRSGDSAFFTYAPSSPQRRKRP